MKVNIRSVAGFTLAIIVLVTTILTGSDDPMGFLDMHGALIVLGGTVAVAAISFEIDKAALLVKIFIRRSLMGHRTDFHVTIRNVLHWGSRFSQARSEGNTKDLVPEVESLPECYLKDCLRGLLEGEASWPERHEILEKQIDTVFNRYMEDGQKFRSLGKFPPAMGLLGAVAGMIAMLGSLGDSESSGGIGPAMAVALVATFYGIAVANFFILPIGENLSESAKEIKLQNVITLRGAELISAGVDNYRILDDLNAYLLPSERLPLKAIKELEAA